MARPHRTFLVLACFGSMTCLAALGASMAACSSSSSPATGSDAGGGGTDGGGGGGDACAPYTSSADLTTPTVSFQHDIMPVFQQSCAIAGATCHGATGVTSQGRPFLGYFDGGADAAQVIDQIVGKPSVEDPKMSIVTASDPKNSYMMHKLDGDQCTLAADCAKGGSQYTDCGQQMPYSSPPLDTATRDTVRRWIAQGAKNN